MTDTNWPDPERPGDKCRPPENTKSETWHWLDCGYLAPFAWRAEDGGAWWSNDGEDGLFSPEQMSRLGWNYNSPCLTPTQISEMLAGERERCAKAAQEISDGYYEKRRNAPGNYESVYADERMCAADECCKAIRNLGAAS